MIANSETWTALRALTDRVISIADDVTVIVVANRKAVVSADAGDRSTEYLSDNEANQLLTGLRASGFKTRYFEGELAFIAAVLAAPRLDVTSPRIIVYNIAQSGTDPGRKSLVPSFCALHGIPVCNSGSYAVSLARNKLHVHAVLRRFGLPTPPTWAYRSGHGWMNGEHPPREELLIAKACQESASIGLDAASVGLLTPQFEDMLAQKSERLGQPMVVQPLIRGREIESPVVEVERRHRLLGPAVITLAGDDRLDERILDYDAVAHDGYGFSDPGPEHRVAVGEIARVAPAACEVLGLTGFARVDFRVADDGAVYVIDVATSPHLVWHSAYAHVFRQAGWRHEEMMAGMVAINAARLGWL
jgi:D-alanine-D-alanine ligase